MIPGSATPFLLAKSGDDGYKIDRSLRFNSGDSAYLSKNFASGNRKTWTWSSWFKLSKLDRRNYIFTNYESGGQNALYFEFTNENKIRVGEYTTSWVWQLDSTAVFRDLSAWYHLVLVVDTTQSTAANRVKVYVNGEQLTSFSPSVYPTQNRDTYINQNIQHTIGRLQNNYADFYLADVHFIDGQALAPTDFGKFDDNNVWQPKEYTGGYAVTGGTTVAAASGAEPILNTSDDFGKTISSGVRTDSNSSNIVLALPLNGSNNGTTITDYHHTIKGSGSAKTVSIYTGSASGGAVTSTAQSKYYGSSFYAVRGATNNYTASDYLYLTGDTDLDFGTGDFCVEFWYQPSSFTQNSVLFDNRHPTTGWPNSSAGFQFFTNHNGELYFNTGSGGPTISSSGVLTVGIWSHIAITRSSGTVNVYHNGTSVGSTSNSSDFNEGRFVLGSAANNGEGSDGYYADLRIYKGAAKYTGNFTVPDKPDGGVNQFYLKFDDNSSNAALGTDSSGAGNDWSVNNLSVADSDGTIYAEFSGSSNQYLRKSGQGVLPGSNGAFTIECHFYPHSTNVIGLFDGGSGQTGIIRNYGNNTIEDQSGGSVSFAGGYTQNAWNHIAVVYTGSTGTDTLTVYVNGVQMGTAGGLNGFTPGSNFDIGTINGGGDGRFDGFIRNFRVTHSVVYSSAFTAPSHTDNLTALTDTKLLVITKPANGLTADISTNNYTLSNNGSVSNVTLAAALENDSFIDTPVNYEASPNNGGNYATLNPLDKHSDFTTSNGNLDAVTSGSSWRSIRGTIGISSGKYYWEFTTGHNRVTLGISTSQQAVLDSYVGDTSQGWSYFYSGDKYNASSNSSYGASYTAGDTIGVAFDADAGSIYFYKNGAIQNSGTAAYTGLTFGPYFPTFSFRDSGSTHSVNFGQRPFKHTVPTGYSSLCTTNLPDPTIADGSTAFLAKTFTANASSQTITTGFSPDLVWVKSRANSYGNELYDIVRGTNKRLTSNTTAQEQNLANQLTSFNSNGFTLGDASSSNYTNNTASIAWAWDGGDLATNSAYNQSQVWSNDLTASNGSFGSTSPATAGFNGAQGNNDIAQAVAGSNPNTVTFTPTGGISYSTNIEVYITNAANEVSLNGGSYQTISANTWVQIASGSGTITSIVFRRASTNGSSFAGIKVDGKELVDPGIIPPGGLNSSLYDQSRTWSGGTTSGTMYSGAWTQVFNNVETNTYSDGNSVYVYQNTATLSFSPALPTGAIQIWGRAGSSGASGDKITFSDGTNTYTTGDLSNQTAQWIYVDSGNSLSGITSVTVHSGGSSGAGMVLGAIRIGGKKLVNSSISVSTPSLASTVRANPSAGFSIVSFTGDGSGQKTISHGLNATPELIILKDLDNSINWIVYTQQIDGSWDFLKLNLTDAKSDSSYPAATSSIFYYPADAADYIAYCFTPVAGYSAIGTYTGNGSTTDGPFVYTGFRPRWVLIKNTEASNQEWVILDTERNTFNVAGKVLYANLSNAEADLGAVNDRHIDILSNGFKVNRGDPFNRNGEVHVYAAFAEHPFKTSRAR